MLKIYNTITREKQDFHPIVPGQVRMYVCGMTVYDYCHLGHARVMVVFDMVARWLRASGFDLTYVRNITDIDDKIIQRAAQNGEPISALTERYIHAMDEDAAALGVLRPDLEPRATQHIPDMLDLIGTLVSKGLAYRADNGDVYYAVRGFDGYGKLSGKSLEDLRAGERVGVDAHKRDPLDFVLWKAAKPGEPAWESPWGPGRPGWHIECSAMSEHHLGHHFDIHGGGQDLQFPHHENEIAQSEGAHDCSYVNYWMHNGFVRVDEEKMSKSLGNFFTIREVLNMRDAIGRIKYDPEVLRYFILRAHYRSPLNYSDQHLDDARQGLTRLYRALKKVPPSTVGGIDWNEPYAARFKAAMDDDFNTSEALAVLFDLVNEVNRSKSPQVAAQLKALAGVLGLLEGDPDAHLQGDINVPVGAGQLTITGQEEGVSVGLSKAGIDAMIETRAAAKKAKNYAEADRIRKELLEQGVVLEDAPQGTTWRRG